MLSFHVNNIGQWPWRTKVLYAAAQVLVLSVAGYLALQWYPLTALQQQRIQQQLLMTAYQASYQPSQQLDYEQQQKQQWQALLAAYIPQESSAVLMVGLFNQLRNLARQYDIQLQKAEWRDTMTEALYTVIPLQLEGYGDYHQIVLFITELAQLDALLDIEQLSLQKQHETLQFRLILHRYLLVDGG